MLPESVRYITYFSERSEWDAIRMGTPATPEPVRYSFSLFTLSTICFMRSSPAYIACA